MSLPLPEGYEPHEFPVDYSGPFWIEGQMKAYGQACRAAALEEAAQICDRDWSCDTSSYETYAEVNKCAEAIRRLI